MTEYVSVKEAKARLDKLIAPTLIRPGAERYAPLRKSARGSWKLIMGDLNPVALVWTDWENGFGIITIKSGSLRDTLDNYLIAAKALDIPAGWAYSSLDTFIETLNVDDAVTVDAEQSGALRGALEATGGLAKDDTESETKR